MFVRRQKFSNFKLSKWKKHTIRVLRVSLMLYFAWLLTYRKRVLLTLCCLIGSVKSSASLSLVIFTAWQTHLQTARPGNLNHKIQAPLLHKLKILQIENVSKSTNLTELQRIEEIKVYKLIEMIIKFTMKNEIIKNRNIYS